MPVKAILGTVYNIKTGLKKTVWLCDYSKADRNKIIKFYKSHKEYHIKIDNLI